MNEISNLPQIESSGKLPTICQKRLEWDWMPVKMLENRLLTEVTTKKDWIMLNPPERLKHNRRELGSCKQTYFSQKHTKHKCWMGFKGTWSTREAFPEGGGWGGICSSKTKIKKNYFFERHQCLQLVLSFFLWNWRRAYWETQEYLSCPTVSLLTIQCQYLWLFCCLLHIVSIK